MELTPEALAIELRGKLTLEESVDFIKYLLESPALKDSTYGLLIKTLQLLDE